MSHLIQHNDDSFFFPGGLFLHADTVPTSFITCIPSSSSNSTTVSCFSCNIRKRVGFQILRVQGGAVFSSLSLSINGRSDDVDHRYKSNQKEEKENIHVHGSGAVNMTKHLWSGAFAAMVSRSLLLYTITTTHTHFITFLFSTPFYILSHH